MRELSAICDVNERVVEPVGCLADIFVRIAHRVKDDPGGTNFFYYISEGSHCESCRSSSPAGLSFYPRRAYIKKLRTAVYRLLAKHTSGRKPTF
jgi:hypothetical protein